MDCHYCHTPSRKFYCCRCLNEKLQNHHIDIDPVAADRDRLINQAAEYTTQTEAIRIVIAERNRCRARIKDAQNEKHRILKESDAGNE
ncbi:hypothetical protein BX666DRAFT_1889708 [Dichotomocladium elegans]|nr:hypothetical protein BX666DRAFT_1889708 [Dichotomocladium elegans]